MTSCLLTVDALNPETDQGRRPGALSGVPAFQRDGVHVPVTNVSSRKTCDGRRFRSAFTSAGQRDERCRNAGLVMDSGHQERIVSPGNLQRWAVMRWRIALENSIKPGLGHD